MATRLPNLPAAVKSTALRLPGPAWLAPLIILVLAGAPYLNTLTADFVLDDVLIVKENKQLRDLRNIPSLFVSHYWSGASWIADRGLYRPLTMATYSVNFALHGDRPGGYHAANVALHMAATWLLFALVRLLFGNPIVAVVAAAWFAVHPIHTEAVAGIVGRAEILAALGVFGCLYGYERARTAAERAGSAGAVRGWAVVALVAYAVACFSKETGLIAPALILALELLRPDRRWLLRGRPAALALFVGCFVVASAFLALRARVIVEATLPHPGWRLLSETGQIGLVATDVRIWTALRVALDGIGQMVWPATLSADYWITDVPLARSPFAPGTLAAILVLAAGVFVIMRRWRTNPALAFGLLAFGITFFPVSNLPFPIGVMRAERLLYTPSFGLLLAAAAALGVLLERPALARPVWIGLAAVTLAFGVRTVIRNFDWQDNHTLAEATLRVSPDSPMMNTNLGLWHRDRGDLNEARHYVERSAAAEPLNGYTWAVLADIAQREGRIDEALAHYEHATRLAANVAQIHIALAKSYFQAQRWPEAARTLERVRELRPDHPGSYVNLANVYLLMGDGTNALRVAEEGMRRCPDKGSVHAIAAGAYEALGRTSEAQRCQERAMQLGIEQGEAEE